MPEEANFARIVFTTAATLDEAKRLARAFVDEQLAACVTLVPSIHSIYRWEGKVEDATETLLMIKTGAEQLGALEARLHELHSYETPEFLALRVQAGSRGYLDWMLANLAQRNA